MGICHSVECFALFLFLFILDFFVCLFLAFFYGIHTYLVIVKYVTIGIYKVYIQGVKSLVLLLLSYTVTFLPHPLSFCCEFNNEALNSFINFIIAANFTGNLLF